MSTQTATRTPEQIINATVNHFGLDREYLRQLKQPKFADHAKGYGRASLIVQALCLKLCGMNTKQLTPILNRTDASMRKARERIDTACREDATMRADVTQILKRL